MQSLSPHPVGTQFGSHHAQTAARIKGPVESATDNFAATVGTTHAVYAVATSWPGRRVFVKNVPNTSAPSARIWLTFGTSSSVEADRTAVVTGTPPAWTGSVKIARCISADGEMDVYVDPSWTHFSVESDENTNKPTIQIMPSDYGPTEG